MLAFKNLKLFSSQKKGLINVASYFTKESYTQVFQAKGIRSIELNDPKTRNSLSMGMLEELQRSILRNQEYQRVIILSSTGVVWSAGHNLKELNEKSPEDQLKIFTKLTEVIETIQEAEIPIIAKVDGIVAAAGVQLMASCDMVVCSDKSEFSCPGKNIEIKI